METKKNVIKVISSFAIVEEENILESDKFIDIGIDSLKIVELIIGIEDFFHIRFMESDLEPTKLTTVETIISLVNKYIC